MYSINIVYWVTHSNIHTKMWVFFPQKRKKLHTEIDYVTPLLSPLVTNGFSHSYHLDESTFIFRGISRNFSFLFHFSMKFMSANRKAPDGTPRFAASHLGLFCLPMSLKLDARLIWVRHTNLCLVFVNYFHSS